MGIKTWIRRWQEPVVWLPLLALLALVAWLVLGALDPDSTVDLMARLIELPIIAAYAVAALGLAWLARRRFRHRLTPDQSDAYWVGLMAGRIGPIVVCIVDAVVWIACFALLLYFFSR